MTLFAALLAHNKKLIWLVDHMDTASEFSLKLIFTWVCSFYSLMKWGWLFSFWWNPFWLGESARQHGLPLYHSFWFLSIRLFFYFFLISRIFYGKYVIAIKIGSFSWTLQVPPENEGDNVNEWTKSTQTCQTSF